MTDNKPEQQLRGVIGAGLRKEPSTTTVTWIDRKKQMPQPAIKVMAVLQYGSGNREIELSYVSKRFPDIFDSFHDSIITHWAYLPELP
jgi:hypothetical protein